MGLWGFVGSAKREVFGWGLSGEGSMGPCGGCRGAGRPRPVGAPADQGGNRLNRSATDEGADNPSDSGVGGGEALFAQDRAELLLAPMGRSRRSRSTASAKPRGRFGWRARRGRRLRGSARARQRQRVERGAPTRSALAP